MSPSLRTPEGGGFPRPRSEEDAVFSSEITVRNILELLEGDRQIEYLGSTLSVETVAVFPGTAEGHRQAARTLNRVLELEDRQQVRVTSTDLRTHTAQVKDGAVQFAVGQQLDMLLLLHEIAHLRHMDHDGHFQSEYVRLVEDHIGPSLALILRHQLHERHGRRRSR